MFYPDVSNHEDGLILQPETEAVIAKATEGRTFIDKTYANFKQQANYIGAVFGAYHWLLHGNITGQAQHAFSIVGKSIPLMIDAEETQSSTLTLSDITNFIDIYRGIGGITKLIYLPRWYWRDYMGSPSLRPLVDRGMVLVASEYRSYSDTNWPIDYGDMTPLIWQYKSTQNYGGWKVDFNAFKGSKSEFATLIGYGDDMTPDEHNMLAGLVNDMDWMKRRVEALKTGKVINGGQENGDTMFVNDQLQKIVTTVTNLSVGNGLSDADRAAIEGLKSSVDALAHQLASP